MDQYPPVYKRLACEQDLPVYRRRMYQIDQANWLEVRDTLDEEFVADGFPCGLLRFEVTGSSMKDGIHAQIEWENSQGIHRDKICRDVASAPAYTFRCRLFQISDPAGLLPDGNIAQIWDTVEEPFEYRQKEMPIGYLLVEVRNFTQRRVFAEIHAYRKKHGIDNVQRWGRDQVI